MGLHLGGLGLHWGTRRVDFGIFVSLWDGALETFGHLLEKASKKRPIMREWEPKVKTFPMIF